MGLRLRDLHRLKYIPHRDYPGPMRQAHNNQTGFHTVPFLQKPESGRSMEILTTEPGVQFYSAFHLGELKNKGFDSYDAFCLETQMYPDAVNQENFQSIILSPGEVYKQKTIHRFSVKR